MSKIINLLGLFTFYFGMVFVLIGMHLITDKNIQQGILDGFKKAGVRI